MDQGQEFDYVVVGGGSAGSVLAGRLSEDASLRVGLFEAGGGGDSWLVKTPAAVVAMLPTKLNNWGFETVPQPGLNGRRGYMPRGKCLGGSSAINAMVYTRGHRWDYDHWASLGNPGWGFDDLLPYFTRSEDNADFAGPLHGRGGPLRVGKLRSDNPWQQTYLQAAREAGFPLIDDFNGPEQEGVGIYQVTQHNGERWSAARAYLLPHLGRPNLSVHTGVKVSRVLFEGRRAVGIELVEGGRSRVVRARREVLLSSGAIQSPQLLMLSGVGPATHLQAHGIPVQHHLPGVGQNLQDHPDFIFGYAARNLDLVGFTPRGGLRLGREAWRFWRQRRGMLTSNYAEGGGFLCSEPGLSAPDLQLHFVVAIVNDHARTLHYRHGYSCHVCLLRPKSRGQLTLANADPRAAPLIDPAFYLHPDDVETMVKGYKLTQRLMDAPALASLRDEDLFTAKVRSDDEIREVLRNRSDTIYHPVGTCKMGSDPMAVVDAQLRVHGLEGLRVVDASIMPTLIGGNTNAPTIAIAEKAVDMIRKPQAAAPVVVAAPVAEPALPA